MTPRQMSEKASVYTETKTDSHTTVHTKTHTPTSTEAAHRVLLFWTPALLTSASQGQSEYSSNSATRFFFFVETPLFSANYSSLSHY